MCYTTTANVSRECIMDDRDNEVNPEEPTSELSTAATQDGLVEEQRLAAETAEEIVKAKAIELDEENRIIEAIAQQLEKLGIQPGDLNDNVAAVMLENGEVGFAVTGHSNVYNDIETANHMSQYQLQGGISPAAMGRSNGEGASVPDTPNSTPDMDAALQAFDAWTQDPVSPDSRDESNSVEVRASTSLPVVEKPGGEKPIER